MRTKLFIAFFLVIFIALVSNLIFERLIIDDFEEYVMSAREDAVYRVLAVVEGRYGGEGWHPRLLGRTVHWAAMLGLDVEIQNVEGITIMTTATAMKDLTPAFRRRMESIVGSELAFGEFEDYPLFVGGEAIGTLRVRPLGHGGVLSEKAQVFKERGKAFLIISFLIAGGGALFLSVVFSMLLTVPLMRLKSAAEAVADGDLTVRVAPGAKDEIGALIGTFNNMVESLRRDTLLRERLTSNVAHELRTPLAIMRANLEAHADGVMPDTEACLKNTFSEVMRLTNLVEGIEDITKAEASFFKKPDYEMVELDGMLSSLVQAMGPLFAKKGLTLEFSGVAGPSGHKVRTDTEKFQIIIRNIIANALAHTDNGGAKVSAGVEGGGFYVEVADTGRGMDAGELEMAFKRFYKGPRSEGIGLGLSIAQELAGVMGGTITAASKPGEGSTFLMDFPEDEG